MHKSTCVQENVAYKFLLDNETQTDHLIEAKDQIFNYIKYLKKEEKQRK